MKETEHYTDTDGKTYRIDSKGQVWLRPSLLMRIIIISMGIFYVVGWLMIIAAIVLLFTDNIVSGKEHLIIFIVGYGLFCFSYFVFCCVVGKNGLRCGVMSNG